jgi:four helix bundle protein
MDVVASVYAMTKEFPPDERFGLCTQLQRAAVSIPANIAEGHARDSTKDFLRHLSIARGSLAEVETFMTLAQRLNYISKTSEQSALSTLDDLSRMLRGLQKSLRGKL